MIERSAYTPAPWGPVAFVPSEPDRPTLRDQFAMAALGGFATMVLDTSDDRIAAMAYTLADAMMEARK